MSVSLRSDSMPRLVKSHRRLEFVEAASPSGAGYYAFLPATADAHPPVMAAVHGIARNAPAQALRFMRAAEQYGALVIAPIFSKERFGQYQQLADPRKGARADEALLAILDDAGQRFSAKSERICLFGYSGGGQFAHRFAMTHPERVHSTVSAAAGWYTFPDARRRYPHGWAKADALGLTFREKAIASLKFHVVVGDRDTERDAALRISRRIDRRQGLTRVARARAWVEAMAAFQAEHGGSGAATLTLLPGVAHSFRQAMDHCALDEWTFLRFAADADWPVVTG